MSIQAKADYRGHNRNIVFVDRSLATLLGALGMLILGVTWHSRSAFMERFAPVGWILIGFFFFNDTSTYLDKSDLVLTIMSAACLPAAIGISIWEKRCRRKEESEALHWFRGAVFYAGFPYMLIAHVPWLNVLAIWFIAWQSGLLLSFAGLEGITIGETWVNTTNGSVPWAEWTGNKWFIAQPMAEHPFHTELLMADGSVLGINFVLACTAIQSMIIFVGATVVLDIDIRKRIRALIITLPVIHILNLFRNAGLIWLHHTYEGWNWLGLSMFDFGHLYAARVGSLAAMFLMAIILFELLPTLHRNVLVLMSPLGVDAGLPEIQDQGSSGEDLLQV